MLLGNGGQCSETGLSTYIETAALLLDLLGFLQEKIGSYFGVGSPVTVKFASVEALGFKYPLKEQHIITKQLEAHVDP